MRDVVAGSLGLDPSKGGVDVTTGAVLHGDRALADAASAGDYAEDAFADGHIKVTAEGSPATEPRLRTGKRSPKDEQGDLF